MPAADVRQRRLVRTPDLAAFRSALVALARDGDLRAIRRRVLVLPSHAAIELFRRTLEDATLASASAAMVLPDCVTREGFVERLHASLTDVPPLVSRLDREVLIERAARIATATTAAPFTIRPGLVSAMLDFYDELRRRGRTVRRFAAVLDEELAGFRDADDRGTAELARQTAFLSETFDAYERAIDAAHMVDEHGVRAHALRYAGALAFDHVVVAVADHPSDPRGLWPADFDLLGRLAALRCLDVIVTDEAHDAGFRERLEHELPGIEETRHGQASAPPVLMRPSAPPTPLCRVSRDREEELRDVARAIRARAHEVGGRLERTAIVYQRPLPYVYLAGTVLDEARVPYQAFDALPLAAEPYAALLDLVIGFARTGGTREAATALLRSPLLRFNVDGRPVRAEEASALNALMVEHRVAGEADQYIAAVEQVARSRQARQADIDGAHRAATAASAARAALIAFRDGASASAQVTALSAFLRAHEHLPGRDDVWRERHLRARSATLGALDALADAYRVHDDTHRSDEALASTIHQAIERLTFSPRRGRAGVELVDAVAARFGAFEHVHVVGLVDAEWPERPARNIFYTSGLLAGLGWPGDVDHARAQQAAFRDLLHLPARSISLSAFQMEGDAVVAPSPMVDAARQMTSRESHAIESRVFTDERLAIDPIAPDDLPADQLRWLHLRVEHLSPEDARYRGQVGPIAAREYRVSSVDRFVQCPFKYFAGFVLELGEEPDEDAGLSARDRGTLLHRLFERFYAEWDHAGRGRITIVTLPDAVGRFETMARAELARLPAADAVLEETRLIGSAVGRGVAERVFEIECDSDRDVSHRWLEHALNATFDFPAGFGRVRRIAVRGTADRIDVLDDGSLRVIDYKLSAAPREAGAVQLPVYGFCASELLRQADGIPHHVSEAYYISFGDDWRTVKPLAKPGQVTLAVEAGAAAFAGHVDAIEAGHFPPTPASPGLCSWCEYALMCRKPVIDAASDDDETAESV